MEFSKKIVIASYAIFLCIVAIALGGMLYGFDMSWFTGVLIASFGEVSASNVFYFKKAESENKIKIAKSLTDEEAERVQEIGSFI